MSEQDRDDNETKPEDRRRSIRLEVDYDLSVQVNRGYTFYTGRVKNISSGGIFVVTSQPHAVGDKLLVRFKLPGMDEPIEVKGTVRWVPAQPGGPMLVPGIGIAFDDISPSLTRRLNEYIADKNILVMK